MVLKKTTRWADERFSPAGCHQPEKMERKKYQRESACDRRGGELSTESKRLGAERKG